MTVARVMIAAFFALAAGVAVENAKATQICGNDTAHAIACQTQESGTASR